MRHEAWSSSTISIASTLQPRALIALVSLSAAPGSSRRNAARRIRWSLLTLCAVTLSCASTLHWVSAPLPRVDGFRTVALTTLLCEGCKYAFIRLNLRNCCIFDLQQRAVGPTRLEL